MKICKVTGNITSTVQHPIYNGSKIMIVQPLDIDLEPEGATFLAVDFVQAGEGDLVFVAVEGNAARQLFRDNNAPVHSVITGIIDAVERN